jgi:uncharacterized membrane protein YfbV (UPF0208 family)
MGLDVSDRATIKVEVADMAWFREVAARLFDLIVALDNETLSAETERRLDLLQRALAATERG